MTKHRSLKASLGNARKDQGRASASQDAPVPRIVTFSLLYESRDGRLCVFEDEHGHLTSVRSERFA